MDTDAVTRFYYRTKSKFNSRPDTSREMREVVNAGFVAEALMAMYSVQADEIFVADHTHEELSPGCASVAMEGVDYDWPIKFSDSPEARALGHRLGIWFEPVNGCILAIIPEGA